MLIKSADVCSVVVTTVTTRMLDPDPGVFSVGPGHGSFSPHGTKYGAVFVSTLPVIKHAAYVVIFIKGKIPLKDKNRSSVYF